VGRGGAPGSAAALPARRQSAPAALGGEIRVQRQAVGPKAGLNPPAADFQAFAKPGGPFTLTIYALTDDMVGHAWLRLTRGDGASKTVGFWPLERNVFYAKSLVMSPDHHENDTKDVVSTSKTITDQAGMVTFPGVVDSWIGRPYLLLGQNCSHFAIEVWNDVVGSQTDMLNPFDVVWSPAGLSNSISFRNWMRAHGLGPFASNDGGGSDSQGDQTAVADSSDSQTTGAAPAGDSTAGATEDDDALATA